MLNDLRRFAEVERTVADGARQGPSLDERRGDVVVRAVPSGIVDGDDVRMSQSRRGLGFAEEAIDGALIVERATLWHLERDLAVELGIIGAVDSSEGPRAQ